MNELIDFVPEQYRGPALVALAMSPYLTRGFHALTNGGGLKGVISAIWLGTNTPKVKTPIESKRQTRLPLD